MPLPGRLALVLTRALAAEGDVAVRHLDGQPLADVGSGADAAAMEEEAQAEPCPLARWHQSADVGLEWSRQATTENAAAAAVPSTMPP
jgi:hypothetical protein